MTAVALIRKVRLKLRIIKKCRGYRAGGFLDLVAAQREQFHTLVIRCSRSWVM